MPSDNGAAWCPTGTGERRLSNSSDGSAGSGYSKGPPSDSADYLQLRSKPAAAGKPATNPLQFVRVGPCELYRSAQQQVKKAEEVKKSKEVKKEDLEDWQSNLDNWKSSRRKQVEHIIERCVEVKRMENEPTPGSRAKNKTFNEMLEERAGKRRKCPLALYPEEETTDLSDLGIGTSSTKSSLSEDCDTHSLASDGIDLDKNHSDVDNLSNCGSNSNRKLGSSANEYDTCTTTTISSPEPEEYTYEGAIEGYKSRMNSDYKNYSFDKEKTPDKVTNGDINRIRTTVSNKIGERVSSLQNKTDAKNNLKKDFPKVDILKRREQFEKEAVSEVTAKPKLPEIGNKKSIKERLSSLEKFTEEQNKSTGDVSKQIPTEVVSLKERLSCLEKVKKTAPESETKQRFSNGDLGNTKSVKERLSSYKSQTSEEEKIVKTEVKEVSMSLKERLSSLDSAKSKEVPKPVICTRDTKDEDSKEQSLKTTLSGLESQMQNFCRSFDSLDINGTASPSSFERVQSLEELTLNDCRNNTSPSDIETEDSGIQTGRSYDDNHLDIDEKMDIKADDKEIAEDFEDISKADTDTSNYQQAVSHPNDDLSATDEITEIQLDKDDEDTLKSLDPQDTSVIDALELAFQEIDDHPVKNRNEKSQNPEVVRTNVSHKSEKAKTTDRQQTAEVKTNETKQTNVKQKKIADVKTTATSPEYESIFYESGDVIDNSLFLDIPNTLEPPKEKPPPPPIDCVEDDVALGNGNFKHTNSTRRIKKEIRNKRTSFLGLEDRTDDLPEVTLAPVPDITTFLKEETKIEKLLYKNSIDSKLRESRDSGVDLDKPAEKSPGDSNQHSRENSELYTQITVTSDEEDVKRPKDQFEQRLACKLAGLQSGSIDTKIDSLDQQLQKQQEVLRFEREILQLEQEELRRQRDNLLLKESQTRRMQRSTYDIPIESIRPEHRRSMPNLLVDNYDTRRFPIREPLDAVAKSECEGAPRVDRHGVEGQKRKESRPMQLPPKPRSKESMEREITMRSSRTPSAVDYVNIDKPIQSRPKPIINGHIQETVQPNGQYHPMTKHTLQALSAAPTPKLMQPADWLRARSRKQIPPSYNYNQHWLIQEAEQRRIEEQNSARARQRHSYHDQTIFQRENINKIQPPVESAYPPEQPRDAEGEAMLSVSGRRKCSHCGKELGRGAAMIIESLSLCYHVQCFSCHVCGVRLGDGRAGADVRVRARKLHCHQCYSSDDGSQFSCV